MHLHHNDDENDEAARAAAATLIQRLWRTNRRNRAKEEHLDSDVRWKDAATHARLKVHRDAAQEGENTPKARWRRAVLFASQLQDKNEMLKEEGVQTNAQQKFLETQHWLELIDGKHRYGSNLKYYHQRWQEEDTTDNFFKWLDYGGGKDLSLDECPRERLEKERIIYLSAEQRLNYLIKIGKDGKLYWAKNNQLVDTSAGDWKDAGDGEGIVPESVPQGPIKLKKDTAASTNAKAKVPFEGRHHSRARSTSAASSASSLSSAEQENEATHYAGLPKGKYRWSRYLRKHFTPRGVMQRLLRKTVRRNTWIYVSDKNFNIFVGIKETGAFQHSSFTAGGIVTSAGLISVKQGVIYTLSPLSGHYRTSTDHFHKFIDVLTERGVDMRKVRISKAEAALWGIEHLAKLKKAQKNAVSKGKKKISEAPKEVKAAVSSSSAKDRESASGGKGDDDEAKQRKAEVAHGQKHSTKRSSDTEAEHSQEAASGQKSKQEPSSTDVKARADEASANPSKADPLPNHSGDSQSPDSSTAIGDSEEPFVPPPVGEKTNKLDVDGSS